MKTLILRDIEAHNDEIQELKKSLKETDSVRMHKRYTTILLHFQGFTNKKIAEIQDLDPHAVGNYIRNYKSKGLAGLDMRYSPGKPRKLNKEQEAELVEIIKSNTVDEMEFEGRKNWTLDIIRQLLAKKFKIKMSLGGIDIMLHRLNLSYTRPTYVLAKADKEKQENFKDDFKKLKKNILMRK